MGRSLSIEARSVEVTLTVSISRTVLNAFSDTPEIGAKKLPAAPMNVAISHKFMSRELILGDTYHK